MPGVFDPNEQHGDLDTRLVAGLERLGQALRNLLRDEAQRHGLSPIQLQLLIQLRHHAHAERRVGALADRFDVRTPTVSDSVKVLLAKGLVVRRPSSVDRRVGELELTGLGASVVAQAEGWADRVRPLLADAPAAAKGAAYALVTALIAELFHQGVIRVARTCRTCRFLGAGRGADAPFHCALLALDLREDALRLDCPEHEADPQAA